MAATGAARLVSALSRSTVIVSARLGIHVSRCRVRRGVRDSSMPHLSRTAAAVLDKHPAVAVGFTLSTARRAFRDVILRAATRTAPEVRSALCVLILEA